DTWLERSARLLSGLGLAVEAVISADAFFGRIGKLLSANQRAAALKHEIVASTRPGYGPTALASCNYHLDHFGHFFGITLADGSPAHSACVGFGPDRIAVALLAAHGTDPTAWPAQLHDQLSP
ncbi:MAG: amino acid--[acyl-carrier-protein] ligase, partial [Acidimicrobiales bacterium]